MCEISVRTYTTEFSIVPQKLTPNSNNNKQFIPGQYHILSRKSRTHYTHALTKIILDFNYEIRTTIWHMSVGTSQNVLLFVGTFFHHSIHKYPNTLRCRYITPKYIQIFHTKNTQTLISQKLFLCVCWGQSTHTSLLSVDTVVDIVILSSSASFSRDHSLFHPVTSMLNITDTVSKWNRGPSKSLVSVQCARLPKCGSDCGQVEINMFVSLTSNRWQTEVTTYESQVSESVTCDWGIDWLTLAVISRSHWPVQCKHQLTTSLSTTLIWHQTATLTKPLRRWPSTEHHHTSQVPFSQIVWILA